MNRKSRLRQALMEVKDRYEPVEILDGVSEYVECMNHSNLPRHLMDTGICPDESELNRMLPLFESEGGIVEKYESDLAMCEEMGLIQLKDTGME